MAAHRLERRTGLVVLARIGAASGHVVVARRDPDPAAVLEPDLRRPEHVPGRVQAQANAEMIDDLAVAQGLQVDVVAQARAQHALGRRGGQVVRVAAPGVIGVRMRDDGAVDRPPRIDVEVAGRAVQPFLALDDQVFHVSRRARDRKTAASTPPQ
jgi:hypothetical protein